MVFKAIITDMDGLLIDSEHIGYLCWRDALEEVGLTLPYEDYLRTVGFGRKLFVKWLIERHGPEFPADEVARRRVEIGVERIRSEGMPRKPGVEALLEFVTKRGITFALASSTHRQEALGRLRGAGIAPEVFKTTAFGDEVERLKPAPDIYLKVAADIGVEPQSIIVLEDSPTGVRAGLAAGMQVIAVPDLLPIPDELREQVLAVAKDLDEVVGLLEGSG
jgi:HAD superfamily hydrolase (TIGR01509 family)